MKKISAAISEEEEFNKKEMANFIENINNYSMRKIENVNYMTHNNFVMRLTKNKMPQQNKLVNGVSTSQPHVRNHLEKSEILNGENSSNIIDIKMTEPKEKIKTLNLLQEMKNNRQLKDSSQSSIEAFRKVRKNI
jgi:fatty acid-binding protein DegV